MELVNLLSEALAETEFRADRGTVFSAEQLRCALTETYWGAPDRKKAMSARPEPQDAVIERLAEDLRQRLNPYVHAPTDSVGHSFRIASDAGGIVRARPDRVVEVQSKSDLSRFARGLIRAAAVIGPQSAVQALDQWAHVEPLRCKICLVLDGAHAAERLELDQGLRVYPLATSSEGFPLSMPDLDWNAVGNILGHTVLEIDAHTFPVFFQPPEGDSEFPPLETLTVLGNTKVDTFLIALSLLCNRRVDVAWSWTDYGDVAAFTTVAQTGLGPESGSTRMLGLISSGLETNITELTRFNPPPPNIFANRLWRAWELVEELQQRMDTSTRFRIAVTRWAKSASRTNSAEDRVIDLRIALESLYLDSDFGELGFRLATTGARHLGTILEERRKIRRTLSDFYGLASRVIHGTEINSVKNTDTELIRRARHVCRDGILKIVEEKHQPIWADLLLE